jgi:DNA-binding CsgD family transcriptional regulator
MLEEGVEGAEGVLSAREMEVLLLAARGLSNGRIARSLHVAEATVKRHLANVYEKMGVGSRGEAAREALLRDWITIEEIKRTAPGTRVVSAAASPGLPAPPPRPPPAADLPWTYRTPRRPSRRPSPARS